ncbi:MAG: 4Fe-4S dicluster domain-containing protein [Elusimicrobia bacterium]|nr:4Fe-4S dicluster domain-containing protein [Elusimicrobiota bacterium]
MNRRQFLKSGLFAAIGTLALSVYNKVHADIKNSTEKESSATASSGTITCTYCQQCEGCPLGIDIPKNFNIYNQFKADNKKENFISAYESIKEENRADKCVSCGICKSKCPQKLDIPILLKDVAELYKKLS